MLNERLIALQEKAARTEQRHRENAIRRHIPVRYRSLEPSRSFPCEDGLFLYGPVGVGKTHAAAQYFLRWCLDHSDWKGSAWWSIPDLLDSMRREYDNRQNEFAGPVSILYQCKTAPLLVLDDLGMEKPSEWVIEQLSIIINHRYNAMRPTIITSNHSIVDIDMHMSSRIASRINSMAFIEITGTDRRGNE